MTLGPLIWCELLLCVFGILSVFRPEWVGAELNWTKWKGISYPRYKKASNPYYMRQIRLLGYGVFLSCLALLLIYLWPMLK